MGNQSWAERRKLPLPRKCRIRIGSAITASHSSEVIGAAKAGVRLSPCGSRVMSRALLSAQSSHATWHLFRRIVTPVVMRL
jgi:hypothetical protein